MNLGIAPPIVNCSSDRSADWETGASGADLIAIAEVGERLGYSHITASEHIGLPDHAAAIRGDTYWDALSTLSYLAARTQTIRLRSPSATEPSTASVEVGSRSDSAWGPSSRNSSSWAPPSTTAVPGPTT